MTWFEIRPPRAADEWMFLSAVRRSTVLHEGMVAPPATPAAFRSWVERADDVDVAARVLFVGAEPAGVANLSEIVRGPFQNAYLGYYALEPHAGHGWMKVLLSAVLDEAFGELELHRVEANVRPENAASIGLVERLGFRREGFSPRYLFLDGAWRDHVRYAMTVEDPRAPADAVAPPLDAPPRDEPPGPAA